jgi:hypothetical protein
MNTVGIRLNIVYASLIIIGLIFSGQSFAEIDSKSIVGVWLFDEGSGKIAKDSSGIGNDGELMNNPKWVEGKFGKALEFDGKDDCVEVPDNDALDVTVITLAAWVKGKANQLVDGNVIVYKKPSYILQYWSATINPGVFVGGTWCGSGWLPSAVIWDNDWHHTALTYDGSKQKFYVDGVFKGENTACAGKIDITTAELTIGTGNVGFYTGLVDEVAIFNVVLGEDDFKSIITKGLKAIAAVFPAGKLTTTWGGIKGQL